jgi:hypothetical protein
MQATWRKFSGTRASNSALKVVSTHQQGRSEFPPCTEAQAFG